MSSLRPNHAIADGVAAMVVTVGGRGVGGWTPISSITEAIVLFTPMADATNLLVSSSSQPSLTIEDGVVAKPVAAGRRTVAGIR